MNKAGAPGRAFSPMVVGLVIAAGVFAFAAFAVLSAYAPDLRRGNDGGAHALSKSAVGYAGLVKLLKARGDEVVVWRGRGTPVGRRSDGGSEGGGLKPPTVRSGPALWIVTPGHAANANVSVNGVSSDSEIRALNSLVNAHEESILVVLPKWSVRAHPRRPGWVQREKAVSSLQLVTGVFDGVDASLTITSGAQAVALTDKDGITEPAGRIESLQVLQGTGFESTMTDGRGGTILAYVESRNTFILSDPDFLNTQGLAELETARAAVRIVDWVRIDDGPVVFDVTLHGFGQGRSLLKLAFAPPFLAVTLCAAAAAALAGWQAAVRFGPRARSGRAFALGKQALADNAAALIKLGGREPRMAGRYAELTAARAARAVAAPAGDEAATAAYLEGLPRADAGSPRFSDLLAEARVVRTREQLTAVARRLHQWRREIAREH